MELWMWYIFYWSFLREDMSICVQTCMFHFQSQAPMDQINFFKWKGDTLSLFANTKVHLRCSDRWISEETTRRPPQSRSGFRSLLLFRRSHMFSGCYYAVAVSISRTRLPLPVSWSFSWLYLAVVLVLYISSPLSESPPPLPNTPTPATVFD